MKYDDFEITHNPDGYLNSNIFSKVFTFGESVFRQERIPSFAATIFSFVFFFNLRIGQLYGICLMPFVVYKPLDGGDA